MLDVDPALEREAGVFTQALTGQPSVGYVSHSYATAHDHLPLEPASRFDDALVEFATLHPLATRAADAYARIFAPRAVLRRKLSVLAAILESTAPFDDAFAPDPQSPAGVLLSLALTGTAFAVLLGIGVVVLSPVRLFALLEGGEA